MCADLNGDGRADIIGFGDDGAWTALSNGDGAFAVARFVLANLGFNQGWRTEQHPRFAADLTGDGRADIIGFGNDGVWTALNNGDGTFGEAHFVIADLGVNQGWTVDDHPRFLADITGDGRADIVAFGNDGVWTALSNGDGSFQAPQLVLAGFNFNQGWRGAKHARLLADLTGNGRADIVGFGDDGVWTALSNGDGTFTEAHFVIANLGFNQGWRPDQHPRLAADLTGDGRADIVAFGNDGVWTAVSNGDGSFAGANFVLAGFNINQGWTVDLHPRFVMDLNGDGRADIVGFGNDGVWTALSNGDGSFAAAGFVLADFGATSAIRHRVISLDFLQSRFDVFFNQRVRPLFQIRLDNPNHQFGKSTVSVAMDGPYWNDPNGFYDFAKPRFSEDLSDLNFSVLGITYNYYFQNLNTDQVTLNLIRGQPLGFELMLHFETQGIEMKVDGHTGHDIDFAGFNIKLRPELTLRNSAIDLFGFVDEIAQAIGAAVIKVTPFPASVTVTVQFRGETIRQVGVSAQSILDGIKDGLIKRFIITDANVDVPGWPDGTVANDVEQQFNSKIYDALLSGADASSKKLFGIC